VKFSLVVVACSDMYVNFLLHGRSTVKSGVVEALRDSVRFGSDEIVADAI
jgi:hypothetical protein